MKNDEDESFCLDFCKSLIWFDCLSVSAFDEVLCLDTGYDAKLDYF